MQVMRLVKMRVVVMVVMVRMEDGCYLGEILASFPSPANTTRTHTRIQRTLHVSFKRTTHTYTHPHARAHKYTHRDNHPPRVQSQEGVWAPAVPLAMNLTHTALPLRRERSP